MSGLLTFLHTTPVHVHTFNTLLAELAPDVPVEHIVEEDLLQEARRAGGITPHLRLRVHDILLRAVERGAAVVVCTCSTIGAIAEDANRYSTTPILRIDRPMAEEAIRYGSRVIVVATLRPTMTPTQALIEDAARQIRKPIQIIELLCEKAWELFEQGRQEEYLQEIARQLEQNASRGDVFVLAQASMAGAIEFCHDLPIPVLTSPRSGLQVALKDYYSIMQQIAS